MRTRQGISLLVLSAIHLVFLSAFLLDASNEVTPLQIGTKLTLLFSLVFIVVAYVRSPRSTAIHSKIETLLFPFVIGLSGVLSFYLSTNLEVGPVIASAGIGFLASFFPQLFKSEFLKSLPAPIYCGTFVGMCGSFLTEDYFFIAYAGLVTGVIYLLTRDALNGIGGKLGTIAFGGVVVVSFIFSLV